MKYAEIFKSLRKEKNLTQIELAEELGVSKSCIAMIETGKNEPTANTLSAYANFFQCSTDYLLGRTDDFGNIIIPDEALPVDEMKLLLLYRKLSPEFKQRSVQFCEKLLAVYQAENFGSSDA